MTLFQRAFNYFSSICQTSPEQLELMQLPDIITSISRTSNEWNVAATMLAADHERNPGKRLTMVCYPTAGVKTTANDIPKMSTSEWNTLALARIYGEES